MQGTARSCRLLYADDALRLLSVQCVNLDLDAPAVLPGPWGMQNIGVVEAERPSAPPVLTSVREETEDESKEMGDVNEWEKTESEKEEQERVMVRGRRSKKKTKESRSEEGGMKEDREMKPEGGWMKDEGGRKG